MDTLDALARCQVEIARDELADVATSIRNGHRTEAMDGLNTAIRQLEAARRHLA